MTQIYRAYKTPSGMARQAGMLGISLEVEGIPLFARVLGIASDAVKDLRPAWNELAKDFRQGEAQVFNRQGAVGNFPKWEALSPNYLKRKLAAGYTSKILTRTGTLANSLTKANASYAVFKSWPLAFEIGTTVPYAILHQSMKPRKMKRGGGPVLPRRDFMRLTEAQKSRWVHIVQKAIDDQIKSGQIAATAASIRKSIP